MRITFWSLMACLWLAPMWAVAAAVEITDLAGRSVSLPQPAQRFVISEGRYVLALSLLRPQQPVAGLVGMMQPVSWTYPDLEQQLFTRFPEARDIALFGHQDRSSVSVEKLIDLKPEVAIFGLHDHGPGTENAELLQQLESAGITPVFIDFRLDPLHNTVPSMRILGQVLGAEAQAEQYIAFYQQRQQAIASGLKDLGSRPTVFLQAHAGRFECCIGMADGMLGPFVEAAGGKNIADAVAPGPTSKHTLEFLLVENPDVWIGTASGTVADRAAGKSWVALGPGMTATTATASLQAYLSSPEFQALDAVRTGRAHAVWHDFYNSPLNIVALEAFAQWLHPERFPTLDPEQTQRLIFETFTPFHWDGVATSTVPAASGAR
ncbi:MAG: ABC transporter substrate-binding protein [Pseudomonadota bacterium]|nr:ABC transporter substrate-binding protein [Pseudomonadota bacterium]